MVKKYKEHPRIAIRGLPEDKIKRLKELARLSGKSLNGFLLDLLSEVAERSEVQALDNKYSELQKQTLEVLEINTQEIRKVQKIYQDLIGE
ncbi:hypothetical protein [Enterococcus sp. LJL90]